MHKRSEVVPKTSGEQYVQDLVAKIPFA